MQKRHSDRVQYFKESAATSQRYYTPYIARFHAIHCNARVLEIGCGEGGNLLPFARQGCEVWGIDLCEERIRQAQDYFQKQGVDGHFDCVDFLCWPKPAGKADLFDIILLHDVIEHVPDKQTFVRSISMFLKSDGVLFVAFPAWHMPFGGHQQICHHPFWSKVPFFHLLPKPAYRLLLRRVAREDGNTVDELLFIKQCATSIELFESAARKSGFKILDRRLWLVNPHYLQKFGLRPRKLCRLLSAIPYVRNLFSTSCFYLLKKDWIAHEADNMAHAGK